MPGLTFVWRSGDPDIATVDEFGVVTTTGLGRVQIEAEVLEVVGSIEIQVLPAGIQQIVLSTPYEVFA